MQSYVGGPNVAPVETKDPLIVILFYPEAREDLERQSQ